MQLVDGTDDAFGWRRIGQAELQRGINLSRGACLQLKSKISNLSTGDPMGTVATAANQRCQLVLGHGENDVVVVFLKQRIGRIGVVPHFGNTLWPNVRRPEVIGIGHPAIDEVGLQFVRPLTHGFFVQLFDEIDILFHRQGVLIAVVPQHQAHHLHQRDVVERLETARAETETPEQLHAVIDGALRIQARNVRQPVLPYTRIVADVGHDLADGAGQGGVIVLSDECLPVLVNSVEGAVIGRFRFQKHCYCRGITVANLEQSCRWRYPGSI